MTYKNIDLKIMKKNGAEEKILSIKIADNVFQRARGLLFYSPLVHGSGLVLFPCNAIHTFFMTYSIDVYFLDKDKSVKKICKNISPWQQAIFFSAKYVLETSKDDPNMKSVKIGTKLIW
ncbi:DUF192 domain-containing protein [Marinibactrum halimedae]|uniref:DUF192 domain-containing protein n=1 Tax=Marinibactrum halimedae TaxID=1444977 RepID=A0AA37T165_9GAMM|nr:DUF192 domain-containing protein [Marinibactrum halimedae]MCD9460295.1 DUF192 domain-containing protein [Marinibactrum halimedae]GLS24383.1 hypothetical protein GCM10007877_00940 [Marinibactrum halimedae]